MILKAIEIILQSMTMVFIGLMFMMAVALILTTVILSLAVSREIYGIYLKDFVWKVRKRIHELLHVQRNYDSRKKIYNFRRVHRRKMSMAYRWRLSKKKRREKAYGECN